MPAGPQIQPHQLVEEQQQPERAEHVVEMVAAVERPDRDHLQRHADQQRRDQRQQRTEHEAAGQRREGRGEIGADHVERAVRQIDQVHDAEDQRQAGRQQEQQHAELDAVEALFDQIKHGRWPRRPALRPSRSGLSAPQKTRRQKRALPPSC